jgi:heme/copper-type cytochrome/quinol oxidase subunit 2
MQAFEVLWVRWLLIMVLLGMGIAVSLFLGFYLPSRARALSDQEEKTEEFPAEIRTANRPIPLFLWLIYVGIFIFIIVYSLYMWLSHVSY